MIVAITDGALALPELLEDNGSGVAGLLAIAKAFKDSGIVPKRNTYFVAFAGEEGGMIGSGAFAEAVKTGEGLPEECKASVKDRSSLMQSQVHVS